MASAPKLLSSLFLLSLLSSLLPNTGARESQFFNKVPASTNVNGYNAKDQSFEQGAQGYGLSSTESGMKFRPGTTTTSAASDNIPYNSERSAYRGTTAAAYQNDYYKNNAAAKYTYGNQYQPKDRFGVQNGYSAEQQQQRQGMSDTRYMNNGVFFYDVNKEKEAAGYNARGVVSTNQYNNNAAFNPGAAAGGTLRFGGDGKFKILQVADMHYADGKSTPCLDVLPTQNSSCSDLNTTAFINRMILAEKPNLIVFTGDNIFGFDATDAVKSMNAAFAPAVSSNIPWAAVLGNHDQESALSREGVMRHMASMKHTLSKLNPPEAHVIDGFGNYNLEVSGVDTSALRNKSALNLYFLDSGDYSTVASIPGYGWIKPSQQFWFQRTSMRLRRQHRNPPQRQNSPAPGLVYFHIPLPEYANLNPSSFTGVKQEGISSASVNSGFFTTMVEAGDVKAVFTGHDHLNDFCGKVTGIQLCYGGGFGYHAYGKAGWARRARVVVASLERTTKGGWGAVKTIKTWKRLDDEKLTTTDEQVLWSRSSSRVRRKKQIHGG